jgi:hypothetical protein
MNQQEQTSPQASPSNPFYSPEKPSPLSRYSDSVPRMANTLERMLTSAQTPEMEIDHWRIDDGDRLLLTPGPSLPDYLTISQRQFFLTLLSLLGIKEYDQFNYFELICTKLKDLMAKEPITPHSVSP